MPEENGGPVELGAKWLMEIGEEKNVKVFVKAKREGRYRSEIS